MTDTFSETVQCIYDSVGHDHLWPRALAAISREIGGFLAALAVFDTERQTTRLTQLACDDNFAVSELGKYAGTIPFYHLLHQMEVGEPVLLDRMFRLYGPDGRSVWERTGLYRNWHKQFRVRDSINMAVSKRPNRVATINISMQRETDARILAAVSMYAPHIRRAVTIHEMFEMERSDSRAFQEVLDRLEHAVLVVSADMSVLYANRAAETLLREQALIKVFDGRLQALPQSHRALRRAISLGLTEEVELSGEGIDVPLGVTSRPAVAHVLPLSRRSLSHKIEMRAAAAAIFVAAAGTMRHAPLDSIAEIYKLTLAEKRVAKYVQEGMTRFEISQAQGVSEATVKTQLSALYDKTATGDQRELQNLMRDLTPPVRRT